MVEWLEVRDWRCDRDEPDLAIFYRFPTIRKGGSAEGTAIIFHRHNGQLPYHLYSRSYTLSRAVKHIQDEGLIKKSLKVLKDLTIGAGGSLIGSGILALLGTIPFWRSRRWDFGLVPSERSLETIGKSVRLHIIGRSKVFDLFPRTDKGKNRCVLRKNTHW